MPTSAPAHEYIGATAKMNNHDHDLVHELSKRLDAVWRYDQYIENARDHRQVRELFERLKEQDLKNVDDLKRLVAHHAQQDWF